MLIHLTIIQVDSNDLQRPWEKSNTLPHKLSGNSSNSQSGTANNSSTNNGAESPRPSRKRFGSASEETILKQVNGDGLSIANSHELETLKADILREVRLEINKAKQEILDGIKYYFPVNLCFRAISILIIQLCRLDYLQLFELNSIGGRCKDL